MRHFRDRSIHGTMIHKRKTVNSVCSRVVRVRPSALDPHRGWLTLDGRTVPVALGRAGIKAAKREGDGGTPRGSFRPRRLWWRADRHPRPRTALPLRAIKADDAWCEDPQSRHY